MKKFLFRTLLALLILVILGGIAAHFYLDAAIKSGVERAGPRLTKVDVKLDAVTLSLLSGVGNIGNPEGFKMPSAIRVGSASLALKPASLLSHKIVVQSIVIQAPEITYELGMQGDNLHKIQANLEAAMGGGQKEPGQPADAKAGRKLEVDDFVITGGKVFVSATALGKSGTISLPEIHLKDLGKGNDGLTPAELSQKVLGVLIEEASKQATSVVADLTKGATYMGKEFGKTPTNATEKVTKGIGDLFKRKP